MNSLHIVSAHQNWIPVENDQSAVPGAYRNIFNLADGALIAELNASPKKFIEASEDDDVKVPALT